jgi:hypothetical protein
MKNIAVLVTLLASVCGTVGYSAELPRKAPELTIPLPDGQSVKISDYRGKVVVLAFILTT